jgi:hypothetical protein
MTTFWDMVQMEGTDMPMPKTLPDTQRAVAEKYERDSGLYFAWRATDGLLQYVGRSKTLGIRVYGFKNDVNPWNEKRSEIYGCLINVILMPEYETHVAELYYIWKLRPFMNGEVKNYLKKQGDYLAASLKTEVPTS